MASIYDVNPSELIEKASEDMKKIDEIKPPEWAAFVKTGMHKERPPLEDDWWYVRTASVLRAVYKLGPIGVSKLRNKYGGRKRRGYKTEHFYKGSGNIARKILQQLEKAGFIKQDQKGAHKGRVITGKGASFLDKIATKISNSLRPIKKPVKEKKPKSLEKKERSDSKNKPVKEKIKEKVLKKDQEKVKNPTEKKDKK